MKIRVIIIAGVSVLVLVGLGLATKMAAPSRVKTPAAGRRSTVVPAKGTVQGGDVNGRLSGNEGRGGGADAPAGRNQAWPGGGKSVGSGPGGGTGAHVPLDGGNAMADASAGMATPRAGHRGMLGNNQIPQIRHLSNRERSQKDFAPFFEKNSLSETQRDLIVAYTLDGIAKNNELASQGMNIREITEYMTSGYITMRQEELKGAIGDELYQSWFDYNYNIDKHELVNELAQRIDSGITWEQREQLVDIFKKNQVSYYRGTSSGLSRDRMITSFANAQEQVMRESAGVLNPQQMAAMRQYWSGIINLPRDRTTAPAIMRH